MSYYIMATEDDDYDYDYNPTIDDDQEEDDDFAPGEYEAMSVRNYLYLARDTDTSKPVCRFSPDGSCQHETRVGGWGIVISQLDGTVITKGNGFARDTTNNRMELTALLEGVKHIRGNCDVRVIEVCTDSRYVQTGLENLANWARRNMHTAGGTLVKNMDLWTELAKELFHRHIVLSVTKIKAHSGNRLNEIADQLAKAARASIS